MRTWCPKPPTAPSALQLSELFYSPSSPARPPCPSRVQDTLLPRSFCAAPPAWKAYSAGHGLGFLWTPCRFWLTGHLCNKAFLTTNIKTQALKKKNKNKQTKKKKPTGLPSNPISLSSSSPWHYVNTGHAVYFTCLPRFLPVFPTRLQAPWGQGFCLVFCSVSSESARGLGRMINMMNTVE